MSNMYVNPAYVDANQMNAYINQMRSDFNIPQTNNIQTGTVIPDANQMAYGVNGNLGGNRTQYYYDNNGNILQQTQPLDPYTINYLTPEAQQEFNYYMSHQNELAYASPEIQELVMSTLNGQQINLQQQMYQQPQQAVGFSNPYEQALQQGYQPQQSYDPYAGYYPSQQQMYQQLAYDPYAGYYQQQCGYQQQNYYPQNNMSYIQEDTSKMPAYQREEYEARTGGRRFKISNHNYNPFSSNPIDMMEYNRKRQEEYEEQVQLEQSTKYCFDMISKKVRGYFGITEEQHAEEQRKAYAEYVQQYQKQAEYNREVQLMDHLSYLDRSIEDDQYINRKEAIGQQIFYNHLAQAKQEMPDDMSILDTLKVLSKKNVELAEQEYINYQRNNIYNHNAYQLRLNREMSNFNNNYMGLSSNLKSGSREPVGDTNFGPIQFRTDSKTGVVNVSCQSEYIRKREAFLNEVRIANDNTNKGQSIGGYIIRN